MCTLKKISALIILISIHFSSIFSQSLIKAINGDLYAEEQGVEENLISNNILGLHGTMINYELDDNKKYYFSQEDDYVFIDLNSNKYLEDILLKASDFPKGFSINEITVNTSSKNDNSNSFIGLWNSITVLWNSITEDSFEHRNEINDLYTTDFQGVERDIFGESKSAKVLPNHYVAVDLNIELFLFEECLESNKIMFVPILDNSRIFIDSKCDSLFIREKNNDDFILCVQEDLSNNQSTYLSKLFSNIENDIDKHISQYLVVRILLENKYIYNSRYYINLYSNNSIISDYIDYMSYQ